MTLELFIRMCIHQIKIGIDQVNENNPHGIIAEMPKEVELDLAVSVEGLEVQVIDDEMKVYKENNSRIKIKINLEQDLFFKKEQE